MSNSLREITKEQFADGTTADGNRLDIALGDLVLSTNNIPPRWMRRRFVHTQFVRHMLPVDYNAPTLVQDNPPFLLTRNLDSQVTGTAPADGLQNEWRLKGEVIDGIPFANYDNQVQGIYAWTSSLYFRKPVIITGWSVRTWQPSVYDLDNTWVWGTDPPEGKNTSESQDDLFLEISVDNPFNMEARNLNDIELHKIRFPVNSQQMASTLPGSPTNDPSTAVLAVKDPAVWVHLDNLCIPLHRDTRARFSIAIPQYSSGGLDVSGWQGSSNAWDPWQSTSFSITLTVLEPLVAE